MSGWYNEKNAETFRERKITNYKFKHKIYSESRCTGVDLSVYVGKTFKQVLEMAKQNNEDDPCANASSTEIFVNSQSDTSYQAELNGKSYDMTTTEKSATINAQGGFCKKTKTNGTWQYDAGCQEFDLTLDKTGNAGGDTLSVMKYAGVTWKDKDRFYSSGKIGFALDGWQGEMSYSGANASPTWSAKNGTEQASGTFTGSASSMGLTAPAPRHTQLSPKLPRLLRFH